MWEYQSLLFVLFQHFSNTLISIFDKIYYSHFNSDDTLKDLLAELEKDLEALGVFAIPDRMQNLLDLIIEIRSEMKKYLKPAKSDMEGDESEKEDIENNDEGISDNEEDRSEIRGKKDIQTDMERSKLTQTAKIIIIATLLIKKKLEVLLEQYQQVNFRLKSKIVTIQIDGSSTNKFNIVLKFYPT